MPNFFEEKAKKLYLGYPKAHRGAIDVAREIADILNFYSKNPNDLIDVDTSDAKAIKKAVLGIIVNRCREIMANAMELDE